MTELIWDGKYDKATGKKCAPPRIILPFQTVETINESAADRHRTLDMFASGKPAEWRNRLVWGDKKYVLPSLLPEFAGKVNLIYIDPPFDTGANFSYLATIPDAPTAPQPTARKNRSIASPNGDDDDDLSDADAPAQGVSGLSFVKEPSVIEQKAYRDTWGKGLDSYLKWFYETVVLLRELLAADGTIYVHIGPNMSHYCKAILDEVFGIENYINEIVWRRAFGHSDSGRCGVIHDLIFLYGKTEKRTWNKVLQAPNKEYVEQFFDGYDEERGERYQRISLSASGLSGGGYDYAYKGVSANWRCPLTTLERHDKEGRLHWPKKGVPRLKRFESEYEGMPLQDLWTDISKIHNQSQEAVGYPTQKPEALLERVLKLSSNPGDLVLDCFCGSGTTAAVAEKLGRRWITCDLGRFAIHTARKRFLAIDNVKPFVVQNLGKYERQQWQQAEFGDNAVALTQAYREFILSLYGARPIHSYIWLHGIKNGHMVHVGGVDAPISVQDVAQAVAEFKRSRGTGVDAPTQNRVDILGWDFAFELNEVSKQQAAAAGVEVKFVRIPREVLEKKAVEQGDIKFFELAALSVDVQQSGKGVILTLKDFVIPLDDVPQEVQAAITHWEQWIDYWAVDWDNKGDTFHNQWQSYRTRKDKGIQKVIAAPPGTYPEPGEYKVVVKVIDILGNDTTKTLKVQVK